MPRKLIRLARLVSRFIAFPLISMISIALGITNLLPIPALDGGQILFLLIEADTGKKIPDKVAIVVNNLFFYALIALMIYITIQDFVNPIFAP